MSHTLPDSTQIPAEALGVVVPSSDEDAAPSITAVSGGDSAATPAAGAGAGDDLEGKRGRGMVFSGAWEQELIISGAVVFALLQLPGAVDAQFNRLEPHLAGGSFTIALMGYQYVKLILYTLIATFVIHLSSRAYWVGLIGLHSVFPGGVREAELKQGPVTAEVYGRLTPTLPRAIAVTDDFCSTLFSFSFMMVAAFLVSTLWCVVIAAATWVVSRVAFGGVWQNDVFWGSFGVFGFMPTVLMGVDRLWGGRLREGGAPHRALKGAITFFYHVYLMKAWGSISRTLFSNLPRRKAYAGLFAVVTLLVTFFLAVDVVSRTGVSVLDGSRFLPDESDARGVRAEVYEDQRPDDEVYSLTPSIPSDVVQGPYVRLFIPYAPRRQDAAIPERCAGVRPVSELAAPSDAQVQAVLACLARIQPVTLNGRPLRAPFRFRTDPRSGVRGIVAYVPTASLPTGENVITVAPAPRARADEALVRRKPAPYTIRFWR